MKKILLFFLAICFLDIAYSQGSPPPPCDPGDFSLSGLCSQACVICNSIDGLVANNDLPDGAPWEAPPGFCAPGLHNTQWVGFVANSTNLTLAISVFNCQMNEGLQIGLYNTVDCSSSSLISNCDPDVFENTTETFTNTVPLTIGGIYFIVVDGYLGDICDFSIDVVAGATGAPDVNGPAPINGPVTVCPGGTANYFSDQFGASIYEWTLDGTIVSYLPNVTINFPSTPGIYELCVTGSNPCSAGDQNCQFINVQPLPPLTQNETICDGETFELGGQVFSTAGSYNVATITPEGCIQDINLNLSVIAPSETNLEAEICLGEVYSFNGQPVGAPGFYSQTLTNYAGCDSIVNLNLIVHQPGSELVEEEICAGDPPVVVAGQSYSQEGLYTIFTQTTEGCDSTIFLRLDVFEPSDVVLDTTICAGETFELGFSFYDQPGVYQAQLVGQGGCDSTITVTLSVSDPQTDLTETICSGESFAIGNTDYSTTGMHTEILTSSLGCDSVVNLDLTVIPPISSTLNEEICDGESYTLDGTDYNTTGNYQATFTATNGCDSTVYLNLDVLDEPETILTEVICAATSFSVGDSTYTASGTYTNTFTAANGCDSTVVLNLTVDPAIETTIDPSICDGDSYTVGSTDYDMTGSYTEVLTAANGCDSTVYLNLTVLDNPETMFSADICEGDIYTLNGTDFDQTGIYTEVFTATNGCDSTVTLDLNVIVPDVTNLNIGICTGQTYTVGTSNYDAAGSYSDVLTSVVTGCDSIVNLTLTVEDVLEEFIDVTLCEGESYTIGSTSYNTTGNYQEAFVTADGCDSIAYLNLTVNPLLETFLTESICDGESFSVGAFTYTSTGLYQNTFPSAVTGCDSTVYLDLTVLDIPITDLDISICDGEFYNVGSTTYNATGTYQDILTAANGCDSIVNLELLVLDVPVTTLNIDICDGETYTVGTSDYTAAGVYQDILTAANGCDSIVDLTLQVLNVPATSLTELICDGETFTVGTSNYTTSGTYTDVLTAANGCDSIVTLDLTVAPIPTTDLVASICDGGVYTVGTSDYTMTGTYQDILTSSVGCDSIVNLTLTVTDFYETNLVQEICDGESFTVGSSTYTTTGMYTDNFISSDGCDSIVNLDLTVFDIPVTDLTEVICDGEVVTVGLTDYTTTGIYQEVLTAITGCDSIVNLNLTVNEVFETNLTEAICDGDSYPVGTSNYTTQGIYQDVLTASNGCDSVVNLDLTVYAIPVTDLTETICFGDSYGVGTSTYNTSGVYQDVLTAFTGCDSIVNLNLTVTEYIETNLDEVICFDDSYTVGSSVYDASGTYQDILTAANGCDSVVNLVLTERNLIETNLTESICAGETFPVGGNSFDATGTYQEVLTSVSTGCDSIVNLDLTVIPLEETFLTEAICDGESFGVGSSSYTTQGTYQDVLTAASGCDSIVYLDLTVYQIPVTDLTETICFGDSYGVGTSTYNTSGVYQDVLTAFTGCDSIVNLNLTVTEYIETNLDETICFGDTYTVGTSTYDQSGVYQDILTASNGCDSVVNLVLTERNLIETDLTEAICAGDTYTVGGASFDQTGIYTEVLTSVATGCDSIVTLDLNVIPLEETFLTEAICDGQSFGVGSSTYTTQGIYQDVLTAASGCDSIVYLDLTVYAIPVTDLSESICDGESFGVGGSTYSTTGVYQDVLTAFTGCDSIVNLNLTVIDLPETFLDIEICDGENYRVGGSTYSTTGMYEDLLTAASGCDSTVYLNLTVNDIYEVEIEEAICNGDTYTVGTSDYTATGTYQDILSTVNGCDSVVNLALVVYPCQLELTVSEDEVSCNGGSDGSITFSMNIGTPPYSYEWQALSGSDTGTGTISGNNLDAVISGLPAGTYEITITDDFDIVEVITVTVGQPTPVSIDMEMSDYMNYNTSCPDDTDGYITALPVGGTPPYSYQWSHNETTQTADDLGAGTYQLTVTDQNGCTATAEATLTAPPAINADLSHIDPACYGDETGSITVDTVMGGVPPYLYSVDGRPFSGSPLFPNLGIGIHTVEVQDANGCIWVQDLQVNQPEELIVDLQVDMDDDELKLGDSTRLFAQTSYPVDTFIWSFNTGPNCINCPDPMVTPARTSEYEVTVIDENGCTATDRIQVFVNRPYDIFVPTAFSPNGDGNNDELMIFAGPDVRQVKQFMIFNRWGETMFELFNFQPNTPAFGWNGNHRSQEMNSGVYVWMAEVEFIDGEVVLFKGDVALMR